MSTGTGKSVSEMGKWKIVMWVIIAWWTAHLVLIIGHVLHVFIYSTAITPGLQHEDYVTYAQQSGPWFSIACGGPVFYVLGILLRRRVGPHARNAGLVVWGLYSILDLAVLLMAGATISLLLAGQWLASQAIKLIAIILATHSTRAYS